MQLGILGPLVVADSEGESAAIAGTRQRILLAALLVRANAVVPADELAEIVWDGAPPGGASQTLRSHVMRLRRATGLGTGGRLVTRAPGYMLTAGADELDVLRFEALCGRGAAAVRAGEWAEAAQVLAAALDLWRGQPLCDVPSRLLVDAYVPRLEELRLQAVEGRVEADLRLGQHARLVPELSALTAEHPLHERLRAQLMRSLALCGRQAEALAVYQDARRVLISELGIEPGQELREAQQQVLAGAGTLAVPGTGTGAGAEPGPAERGQAAPGGPVRYSLPPDAAAFTGRAQELDQIMAAGAGRAGGVAAAVWTLGGMPGVGKTALAVHAGHLLTDRFPDRQLFVDLHAHTPGQDPVRPEDALAGLLTAAGVDPRFVPADLDGRAGMWRDKMAGQQALLVLDNAASSAQVAPLLPGGRDCLVLVTSRRHLGDLPGVVVPVLLSELPAGQAAQMFTRLAPRAAPNPAKVAEVVRLAGCLPLAVSLLARVLARHRSWTLADLAADTQAGLLTLTAEHECVAAAFEVSYRHLNPAAQRLFRLLGLHPGATTDAWAAAALAGISPAEAVGLLDGLHGEGLVTEPGYRRYGMHDLLRRYARSRAAANPDDDREQALDRLFDYYQRTAIRAQARLAHQTRPGATGPGALLAAPALDDAGQALAWARADRDCLIACLDHATRTGQHARITALASGLAGLLRRDGPWTEAVTRHATAAEAGRHLGDRLGEANALTDLGDVRRLTGDYLSAARDLEDALTLYRDLGDRLGQANALTWLGDLRRLTSDYPAAGRDLEQALALYRDLGDRLGQANALTWLGDLRRLTSDYPAAGRDLEQALALYRDLGDRLGQAHALTWLGVVRRQTGDYPAAGRDLEQALALNRDLGNQLGQAIALADLGNLRRQTGDYPAAVRDLEQALALNRDIGNQLGQANVLVHLGDVRRLTGDCLAAARDLEQALALNRDIGNRLGQATALNGLGVVRRQTGDYLGAARDLEQALATYRDIGSRLGQANALTFLGVVQRLTGAYPAAARALEQALALYRDIGDRDGEAEALNESGTLHRASGELAQAQECHRQALELARVIASAWHEAQALACLGRCAIATGEIAQAQALLRQAHEIFQQIGAADAPAVLAELNALVAPDPNGQTLS
jgi:DNA-binding SARP family transcriptional activator